MRNLQTPPEIKIHNLGEIATTLRKINFGYLEEADFIEMEMKAFGAPSECSAIAYNGMEAREEEDRQKVFKRFGVTEQQYRDELRARCCGKYIYFQQLD